MRCTASSRATSARILVVLASALFAVAGHAGDTGTIVLQVSTKKAEHAEYAATFQGYLSKHLVKQAGYPLLLAQGADYALKVVLKPYAHREPTTFSLPISTWNDWVHKRTGGRDIPAIDKDFVADSELELYLGRDKVWQSQVVVTSKRSRDASLKRLAEAIAKHLRKKKIYARVREKDPFGLYAPQYGSLPLAEASAAPDPASAPPDAPSPKPAGTP